MFILIDNCIVNPNGSLAFELVVTNKGSKVWSERSKASIVCDSPDDARACLLDLAERLYARRWDGNAKCFVPVTYNPDSIARIFQYLSHDGFPASSVEDVLFIVSLMNLSRESDQDVQAFLKAARAKDYFDLLCDEPQERDERPLVLLGVIAEGDE